MDFGGIGIGFLLQRERAGSTTFSSFLHRGLYKETDDGKLIHVFTQDPAGNLGAGELLDEYTGQREITVWLELNEIFFQAFVISGLCRDPSKPIKEEDPSKNQIPPTQSPQRRRRMGSASPRTNIGG